MSGGHACSQGSSIFVALICTLILCAGIPGHAGEIPSGKTLEIRLTRSLASFSSKKGSEVEGVIIAPVLEHGQVLIPMGAKVTGTVRGVRRVGLGLIHESARLSIEFNHLILPDGSQLTIDTRVAEIDNARESVDAHGRVTGIRSTGTIGYRADNLIAGFAMFDPIAYLYVTVASARVLRFSEPEIWFPAGTELSVKLLAPVELSESYGPPVPSIQSSPQEKAALRSTLRSLPYRTRTADSNKPSDLTNLVFLGTPGALERAFLAAGWMQSDRLNTITGFLTLRSIAESQRYQSAPMSILLLDEQRPRFTFSKSLDTFSKRHHVRIWLRSETWNGMPILTASSTQDIGIQLSRKNRTFIHVIDTNIDNERAKIVDDLIFTGCVDAAELYPRPWVVAGAQNATGEALKTDRRVAVLQLNDCSHPRDPVDLEGPPDKPVTGRVVERGFRQGILITRNDIYRGNLIYQSVEGTKLGVHYLKHRCDAGHPATDTPPEIPSAISSEPGGNDAEVAVAPERGATAGKNPPASDVPRAHTERPALFELGVHGGWLRFGDSLAETSLSLESRSTDIPSFNLFLRNRVKNGWAVGTSITLNSWKHFSNEFSFDYQEGKYRLGASFSGFNGENPVGYEEQTTGFLTNQFGYALLFNLRSREKRVRPYVAAGTAFQLLHITDAPFKSSGGVFKVGLRNVGLILAAYNFANNPPLDGGGVFQFGFQYGGGIKYRITRRWLAQLDYRETLSPQPNFVERSIHIDDPSDSDQFTIYKESNQPSSPLREQRLTAGISFVF